jgi:hypothetical protein
VSYYRPEHGLKTPFTYLLAVIFPLDKRKLIFQFSCFHSSEPPPFLLSHILEAYQDSQYANLRPLEILQRQTYVFLVIFIYIYQTNQIELWVIV